MGPTRVMLTSLLLFSGQFCQAIEPPDGLLGPELPPIVVPIKQRSLQQLQAGLRSIADEGRKVSATDDERERKAALLRLRSYRFLCSVPQAKLTLDASLDEDAVAVADICSRLGKLTHEPENPDLPEEEYQRARTAAGKCNLANGPNSLTKAIDIWMDDSDEHNVAQLGHRRWCLNPSMQKLGLGRVGDYCAMWALDSSGTPVADYDVISFPPPGFVPLDFFGEKYAWSITLNPAKYLAPELEDVEVQLFPLERGAADRANALEIENLAVDTQGFGVSNCLIFQPKEIKVAAGKSYSLEIRGLQTRDGQPATLTFPVHFVAAMVAVTNKSSP
ncbi:hypothetical protein ETAA8_37610 [Anatilimnocola aggregata]|uniref:SCP domain-containing protein n=1 Tax=Anatilimnocola aggregata TaxID=2528021 RepID=A0A517YEM4_9BACT|nr:CAP domain-containing protein [Anatilimnocola aggregata]QDU28658.1 hypothetical protein ETAA8_37610 [Anatilimnocola aggregata]